LVTNLKIDPKEEAPEGSDAVSRTRGLVRAKQNILRIGTWIGPSVQQNWQRCVLYRARTQPEWTDVKGVGKMKIHQLTRWVSGSLLAIVSAAGLVFSSAASAAPMWCTVMVSNLYVRSDGTALVHLEHTTPGGTANYVRMCNLRQTVTVGSVAVDAPTCMAWFAMTRTGVQLRRRMIFFYEDLPSCQQLPAYDAAPLPSYVMLE
jgi:hypothetical protein